jgi:hypothetical protein
VISSARLVLLIPPHVFFRTRIFLHSTPTNDPIPLSFCLRTPLISTPGSFCIYNTLLHPLGRSVLTCLCNQPPLFLCNTVLYLLTNVRCTNPLTSPCFRLRAILSPLSAPVVPPNSPFSSSHIFLFRFSVFRFRNEDAHMMKGRTETHERKLGSRGGNFHEVPAI